MRLRVVLPLLTVALLGACSAPTHVEATQDDPIVSVPQTELERQSIGDSWLYAEASWIATLSGGAVVPSPAYWAYWHAFDQISSGFSTHVATGGNWRTASGIVLRYGVAPAGSFLASSTIEEAGARRDAALAAVNASLGSGALADPAARRDRALVRRELDRAWGLSDDEKAALDAAFGATVARTFTSATPADTTGTPILAPSAVAVTYPTGPGAPRADKRLVDAIREWHVAYYADADPTTYVRQLTKALDDEAPVLMTWFVDFDALEDRDNGRRGAFNLATLNELGPGTQAGDTALLTGYARDASGAVQSLRALSPWGLARPARVVAMGAPKVHDVWLDYLDGPIKRCAVRDGATDTTTCPYAQVPLQDVVLPPGY